MRLFLFTLLFFFLSNFKSEAKKLDSLFKELDTTISLKQRTKILSNIGVLYYMESNYDKAIDYTVQSITIGEQIGDTTGLKTSYLNLGAFLIAIGQYEKGMLYFKKCLAIAELQKDSIETSKLYINIGATYIYQKEYDSSLLYFNRALKVHTLLSDSVSMSNSLLNMAVVYAQQSKQHKAIDYYQKSLRLLTPFLHKKVDLNKHLKIANFYYRICINIAQCYIEVNNTAKAMYYLQKVIDSKSEYVELEKIMEAENILATLYKRAGNYRQSIEHFMRYTQLKDSIFNMDKIKSINEVTVKYETDKKDRENRVLQMKDSLSKKNILIKNAKIRSQRTFIWGGLIVAFLLFSLLLFSYRKKKIVEEFNIELNRKNDLLSIAKQKVELKALLNQINPHFIFNALNSIQQFILRNDTKSALDYFGKFGNLLRSSLEHSELSFVTIKEELDLIKNYVHLENLRFETPVQLIVDTGEIDIYSVKMPPMFIQPFIENTFAHGFNGKNENKHIKLSFTLNKNVLECTVTDNGNGRDAARMVDYPHRYSGIQITENRLKSIWEQVSEFEKIQITDLKDENNLPIGTMVSLKLPYTF